MDKVLKGTETNALPQGSSDNELANHMTEWLSAEAVHRDMVNFCLPLHI